MEEPRRYDLRYEKPKKHKRPVRAIREHCLWCLGGSSKEVELCTSPDCALFEFRFGKNPYHKQDLTEEQRRAISDRAKKNFGHD